MHRPENVIFDFGGVLLDLHLERSRRAFVDLGIAHFDELFNLYRSTRIFEELETGDADPEAFLSSLQAEAGRPVPPERLTDAWNALLGDYRLDSLRFVERLNARMPVFLYSNTNIIHYRCFQQRIAETTPYGHLDELFRRAYYSHEMRMRKPHAEGYLHILDENGLEAGRTLFVDDNADNIAGAASVGLQTHRLLPEERIERVLAHLLADA